MAKKVKFLGIVAAVAMIGFSMTGCDSGGNGDELDPRLFGIWDCSCCGDDRLHFNSNGTLAYEYTLISGSVTSRVTVSGTWSTRGNILSMTFPGFETDRYPFSISGNNLDLEGWAIFIRQP